MIPFRDNSVPAPARILALAGDREDLPPPSTGTGTAPERESVFGRRWKREARDRGFRACRRTVRLEEIPEERLPVILELNGGSRLALLRGKEGRDALAIQFPDAREAVVERERIGESYDGTCIFLQSREDGNGDVVSFWRRVVRGLRSAEGAAGSWIFNSLVLVGVALAARLQGEVLAVAGGKSLFLPLLVAAAAGFACAGLIQLRRDFLRNRGESNEVDLAFVPVFLAVASVLAGAAALPFVVVAGVLLGYLGASSRLGSIPSRLESRRARILHLAFLAGAAVSGVGVATGSLAVEEMVAALGLGTYATWILATSDRLWQRLRLEAL